MSWSVGAFRPQCARRTPGAVSASAWLARVLRPRRARVALMFLAAIALAASVLGASACSPEPSESALSPLHEAIPNITGLRVLGEHRIEVTDARAVELFRACLVKAEEVDHPAQDVTRVAHVVTVRVGDEWETEQREFIYRHSPFGLPLYVRWGERWYRVPGDFSGMISAVRVYNPDSYAVDSGDEHFLQRYGFTPFFLLSTTTVNLPDKLIHKPGDFPEVIYWARGIELSSDVGLDLSSHLGKAIEARLYKVAERLPEQMGANRDFARAVVVRAEGRIVGAWLAHGDRSRSLQVRTLEEVTGKSFDDWVTKLIDPADPMEQRLAEMTPEEVIETYFFAIDHKDYATAHACQSRSFIMLFLTSNSGLGYRSLYNEGFLDETGVDLGNYISVKVVRVTRVDRQGAALAGGSEIKYDVELEQRRKIPYGSDACIIVMRKETPSTGWKIHSMGTG